MMPNIPTRPGFICVTFSVAFLSACSPNNDYMRDFFGTRDAQNVSGARRMPMMNPKSAPTGTPAPRSGTQQPSPTAGAPAPTATPATITPYDRYQSAADVEPAKADAPPGASSWKDDWFGWVPGMSESRPTQSSTNLVRKPLPSNNAAVEIPAPVPQAANVTPSLHSVPERPAAFDMIRADKEREMSLLKQEREQAMSVKGQLDSGQLTNEPASTPMLPTKPLQLSPSAPTAASPSEVELGRISDAATPTALPWATPDWQPKPLAVQEVPVATSAPAEATPPPPAASNDSWFDRQWSALTGSKSEAMPAAKPSLAPQALPQPAAAPSLSPEQKQQAQELMNQQSSLEVPPPMRAPAPAPVSAPTPIPMSTPPVAPITQPIPDKPELPPILAEEAPKPKVVVKKKVVKKAAPKPAPVIPVEEIQPEQAAKEEAPATTTPLVTPAPETLDPILLTPPRQSLPSSRMLPDSRYSTRPSSAR